MKTWLFKISVALLLVLLGPSLAFAQDFDGDGLDDAAEAAAGSNPSLVDTDADGLGDGAEVLIWGTDPTLADSDGGGEWDLAEIFLAGTDPTDPTDDSSGMGGGGAFHYWIDVATNVNDENRAEEALASPSYQALRSFRWPFLTDFQRGEPGDFGVNTLYTAIFGGARDDYAGVVHGWLYIPPVAGNSNQWSLAVGAADGWWFEAWEGGDLKEFHHDGGGFKAEREVFDFPTAGGMYPFEVVTWEDGGSEAFELSWAQGDVNYDPVDYQLIPPQVILASRLVATQTALDVNGSPIVALDTIELTVTLTNSGQAAAYDVQFRAFGTGLQFGTFGALPDGWSAAGPLLTIPIVDAQSTVEFTYTVTTQATGPFQIQGEIWADAFPSSYGIGDRRIRVLTDDPLAAGTTDTANRPIGLFGDGLIDDDPTRFDLGDTIDVDQCALGLDDCDVNATCDKVPGSWTCTCDAGYEGTGQVCTDIDECTDGLDDCGANTVCVNEPGGFSCDCAPGYMGDGVTCTDVDECTDGTDNCDTNASCTNTDGGFDCACDAGWTGDGATCTDVDECADGTAGCATNATCTNLPGGFDCACDAGFAGDGFTCTDVDECLTDPCDPNASCSNDVGGFACTCNAGWTGDGLTCTDVDECSDGTAGCAANATCTNEPGGFDCSCDSGFEGDGLVCDDIDECATAAATCDGNASCTNTTGSFECVCNDGWQGDGTSCTDVDECADGTHDCDAIATCTNTPGAFECECPMGYDGDGRVCTLADCPCTADEVCVGGECFQSCEVSADCSDPGHRCYDERCTDDPCNGIECPSGEACVSGACFVSCAGDVDCENPADLCFESRCAEDACAGIVCATEQVCWGGGCFETCGEDVDCSNPDDLCYDGRCTDDPCRDVQCPETQVCWGGGCFEACGSEIDCSDPSHQCYESRCAADPCDMVQCASSATCFAGHCRTLCSTDADCTAPDVCDRGICSAAPNIPDESCGCASPGGAASEGWIAFLLLGALRWRWRR